MLAKRLPVPAYDHLLKLSHTFNLLDARGAVGVTGERSMALCTPRQALSRLAATTTGVRLQPPGSLLPHGPRTDSAACSALSARLAQACTLNSTRRLCTTAVCSGGAVSQCPGGRWAQLPFSAADAAPALASRSVLQSAPTASPPCVPWRAR